ncbi:MAG: hypothetical protein JW836_07005 [Deltaproteobacteria bacterium]|nr:hypothetical protein [Deltaproteobacteria bacterium]
MAEERDLDDQIDSDEELLNFELGDSSLSRDAGDEPDMDEEIIELVDLVERGSSEDITRELKAKEWAVPDTRRTGISRRKEDAAQKPDEIVEPELDFSDISLEPEMETSEDQEVGALSEDELTNMELKNLLKNDDGTSLDFTEEEDELEQSQIFGDEITDADLQALLSEAEEEDIEEDAADVERLKIVGEEEQDLELELFDETQLLNLGSALEEKIVEKEPTATVDREMEASRAGAKFEKEGALPSDVHPGGEKRVESEIPPVGSYEESGREETELLKEQVSAGLTEEKLEAIITGVVREVVEKVTRETMAEVAERMIGEAIETLKKSLEASEQ